MTRKRGTAFRAALIASLTVAFGVGSSALGNDAAERACRWWWGRMPTRHRRRCRGGDDRPGDHGCAGDDRCGSRPGDHRRGRPGDHRPGNGDDTSSDVAGERQPARR